MEFHGYEIDRSPSIVDVDDGVVTHDCAISFKLLIAPDLSSDLRRIEDLAQKQLQEEWPSVHAGETAPKILIMGDLADDDEDLLDTLIVTGVNGTMETSPGKVVEYLFAQAAISIGSDNEPDASRAAWDTLRKAFAVMLHACGGSYLPESSAQSDWHAPDWHAEDWA